jgi:NADPH:quinone reductase-like Zn-dependent oxidoreductase
VSAGICGSDIGIYNGTNSLASYPRLIGHEYGGVVEAAGAKVSNWRWETSSRWTGSLLRRLLRLLHRPATTCAAP